MTTKKNETTSERTVSHTERMRSSVNGNPRFRVFFTDGYSAPTQPDAAVAYGINNPELRGDVTVTQNGRGHITYMKQR